MYNGLIDCLEDITEGDESNNFGESIPDQLAAQEYGDLLGRIETIITDLRSARDLKSLYGNYDEIELLLEKFRQDFEEYEIKKYKEILLNVYLSKSISNQITDLNNTIQIDSESFELVKVNGLDQYDINFYHYSATTIQNSLFLINPANLSDLKNYLSSNNSIDIVLLFLLQSKLTFEAALSDSKYVLIKSGHSAHKNRIISTVLLHYVSDGNSFHQSVAYSNSPINHWRDQIDINNRYQQFSDSIYILSEYNETHDIISKYLKIYQIIEDFMYKYSLVRLEAERNGVVFSLRDFKRLNEEIQSREIDVLSRFIKDFLMLESAQDLTFKAKFKAALDAISAHYNNDNTRITVVLKLFGIDLLYQAIDLNSMPNFLSKLIYYIRNSIVHNKTTEFHLTYNTLTDDINKILSLFLIPCMEEICYFLISKPGNPLIWFTNKEIKLWEDN